MKNIFLGVYTLLCVCVLPNFNNLLAQIPTPIAFGQTIVADLPLTSSTKIFSTPAVQPGDVLLARAVGFSMDIKMEIFSPTGQEVAEANPSFVDLAEIFYKIPANGESGVYRILVSNDGGWTGGCCVSLERMNASPAAQTLGCDQSLSHDMDCDVSIKSYRFLATQGMISRIVVAPRSIAPEAWVCAPDGTVLKTGKKSYAQNLILDSIYAANTGCYYIYVVDDEGEWDNSFTISHSSIFGTCPGVTMQTNPASGSVCVGGSATLSASFNLPGASFLWSGPDGFTSNQAQINLTNLDTSMAGAYTVTVTHPSVCTSVATKTLVVRPLPTIDAVIYSNPDPCAGESFQLRANTNTNVVTYRWTYPNGTSLSSSQTVSVSSAGILQSGYYKVVATDGNGCSQADSVLVAIHPKPTAIITASNGNNVCVGNTLRLNATTDAPNATFAWRGPDGFQSNLQSPTRPNMANINAGTYFVTVTNPATECTASSSFPIYIQNEPSLNVFGVKDICKGESLTLSASSSASTPTFAWSTSSTMGAITITPQITSTYTVTVTSIYGCTKTQSPTIVVKPLPTASITSSATPAEICSGTGTILLCGSTNAQNPTFTWSGPGLNSFQQCISISNPNQTGTQVLKVKDGISGCENTSPFAVAVHQTPTASILEDPSMAHCAGDNFIVCANSNATSPTYVWAIPGGNAGAQICLPINHATLQNSGGYAVTVTDVHGCTGTAQKNIVIRPAPIVRINGDSKICAGSSTILLASGASNYVWDTGWTGNQLNTAPSVTQTYSVTGTDNFGCEGTASTTVEVAPNTIQLSAVVLSGTIQATAFGGQPPYAFSLFPPAQLPNQTGNFVGLPSGNYTVKVTDDFGCTESESSLIVMSATAEPAKEWGVTIGPNPNAGDFWVHIKKMPKEGLNLILFDAMGREIRYFLQKNGSELWHIGDLPNGYYYLRISDATKAGMMTVLKI